MPNVRIRLFKDSAESAPAGRKANDVTMNKKRIKMVLVFIIAASLFIKVYPMVLNNNVASIHKFLKIAKIRDNKFRLKVQQTGK